MVEIQFTALNNLTAVLAGVLVALEDVVAGKFYIFLRQAIEKEQHDHAGHTDLPRNRGDHFMLGGGRGKVAPALEIVGQEIVGLVTGNDMGMAGITKAKARRAEQILTACQSRLSTKT